MGDRPGRGTTPTPDVLTNAVTSALPAQNSTMPVSKPLVAALAALAVGVSAAAAFESVYRISFRPRSDREQLRSVPAPGPDRPALTLRLVDSGGIGIPIDEGWGADYSHDRRTFREVIQRDPPYVDVAAFQRVERQWQSYVDQMLAYGSNGITVPLLLELIDFDRVGSRPGSGVARGVYDPGSSFLGRHAAVRREFAPLFDWTARRGMQVFLDTVMLAVTPPL